MDRVLELVERSNQRGGRMLSVIDLIDAGTFTRAQVCRLLARIETGASWLVGAAPGGAGKTTIMSALLAMLPAGERVRLAHPGTGWEKSRPGECVVAYEISPGAYDAYVWGADLRRLAGLGVSGCRIVSNLHADTLAQARAQIVGDCGAAEEGFTAFDIFLPIELRRRGLSYTRTVKTVHYHDGDDWQVLREDPQLSAPEKAIAGFLEACFHEDRRTCPEVRSAWLRRLEK